MTGSGSEESQLQEALGCLVLLFLFVACFGGPPAAYFYLGAWAGLVAAVIAVPTWMFLGPPPFPGFLPGLLAMVVLFNGALWAVMSIIHLILV